MSVDKVSIENERSWAQESHYKYKIAKLHKEEHAN